MNKSFLHSLLLSLLLMASTTIFAQQYTIDNDHYSSSTLFVPQVSIENIFSSYATAIGLGIGYEHFVHQYRGNINYSIFTQLGFTTAYDIDHRSDKYNYLSLGAGVLFGKKTIHLECGLRANYYVTAPDHRPKKTLSDFKPVAGVRIQHPNKRLAFKLLLGTPFFINAGLGISF